MARIRSVHPRTQRWRSLWNCTKRAVPAALVTVALSACAHPHPQEYGYGNHPTQNRYSGYDNQTGYRNQPLDTIPTRRPAVLSVGTLKRSLRIGVSTQEDALRVLGSPNNMTFDSRGHEVWVYDRIHTEVDTSGYNDSAGINIGIGAFGSPVGAGALFGGGHSHSRSSLVSATKSLTIILEFDRKRVLRDMLAREGRY